MLDIYNIYIYIYMYIYIIHRGYFRLKLCPTSGRCTRWLIKTIGKRLWTDWEVKLGVPFITFLLWNSAFFVYSRCIYNRFIMSCHEQVYLIMFNERYYFVRYFFHHWDIVGTPPPPTPFLQWGVEPPTKFSKREWAWQDLNF